MVLDDITQLDDLDEADREGDCLRGVRPNTQEREGKRKGERWGERCGERWGERWSAKVVPAQVPPPHHHINANAATAIPAGRRRRMSAPVMCSAPVTISITSEATAPPPHGPSALLSHGAVVPFPSTFPSPRLVERPRTATATSPSYNSPYSYSPSRSRTDGRDAPPTLRGASPRPLRRLCTTRLCTRLCISLPPCAPHPPPCVPSLHPLHTHPCTQSPSNYRGGIDCDRCYGRSSLL